MPKSQQPALATAEQLEKLSNKIDVYTTTMTEKVSQIQQDLATGKERASILNERLFGHEGQPGIVQYMNTEHKALADTIAKVNDALVLKIEIADKTLDDKIDKVKSKVTWYSGGIAAIVGAAGLIIAWLQLHLGVHP